MALAFISENSANSNTLTMPTHQANDLLILWQVNNVSNADPSVPTGWIGTGGGSSTGFAASHSFRIAQSSSETIPAQSNTNSIAVAVYRDTAKYTVGPGYDNGSSGGSQGYIQYPGGVREFPGSSWIVRLGAHKTATNQNSNLPAGYVARTSNPTRLVIMDTNGIIGSDPTTVQQSLNATSNNRGDTVEIAGIDNFVGKYDTFFDDFNGTSLDTNKWIVPDGTPTVSNSAVTLNNAEIDGKIMYDWRDSSITFDAAWHPSSGDFESSFNIGNAGYCISLSSGMVRFNLATGYGYSTDTNISYNATTMRYKRFRNTGLSSFWETSPDGQSWTIRASATIDTALRDNLILIGTQLYIYSYSAAGPMTIQSVNVIKGGNFIPMF